MKSVLCPSDKRTTTKVRVHVMLQAVLATVETSVHGRRVHTNCLAMDSGFENGKPTL